MDMLLMLLCLASVAGGVALMIMDMRDMRTVEDMTWSEVVRRYVCRVLAGVLLLLAMAFWVWACCI